MPPRRVDAADAAAAAPAAFLSFSGLQQVTAADFLGANEEKEEEERQEEGRKGGREGGRRGLASFVRSVGRFVVGALQVIFHASRNSYGSENDREEREERARERTRERAR